MMTGHPKSAAENNPWVEARMPYTRRKRAKVPMDSALQETLIVNNPAARVGL